MLVHRPITLSLNFNMGSSSYSTVNSLYGGHHGDLKLVSPLARACNTGSLFQSIIRFIFAEDVAAVRII